MQLPTLRMITCVPVEGRDASEHVWPEPNLNLRELRIYCAARITIVVPHLHSIGTFGIVDS